MAEDKIIKDDGMRLIIEPGYKMSDLQLYIESSVLAKRCAFIKDLEPEFDVVDVIKSFLKLLDEELNLDEIATMFVIASMLYFIQATPYNLEWREHLLQKAFLYSDTVKPMHLHFATKRMWNSLKSDGISFVFNILTLCNEIAIASDTGKGIAISLIWAIVSEITETETEIYCFRDLSELNEMLSDIDDEMLQMDNTTNIVYVLVRCIGFLINYIVFCNNTNFLKTGYREYFTYTLRDLEKLQRWAEKFCETLRVAAATENQNWDLRMSIKEYVNSNIIGILQDKINDLKFPLDSM